MRHRNVVQLAKLHQLLDSLISPGRVSAPGFQNLGVSVWISGVWGSLPPFELATLASETNPTDIHLDLCVVLLVLLHVVVDVAGTLECCWWYNR